jgi:tRNA threonylcarbamoyladenosine biosynthesis protein TsaB
MKQSPRLLIVETSGRVGQVAVALGGQLGEVRRLEESRRHARDLAPAAGQLCAARGWKLRDLDAVIVSLGPGSYTGLRVGLISAKTLAYATGCKLIGVETFAAIARQAPPEANAIEVIADAQQRKLYVQRWRRDGADWRPENFLAITTASEWLAELRPGTWVGGPGVRVCESSIPAANRILAAERREPSPESLLQLGLERWSNGAWDDLWKAEPIYLRPSNAEENWDRVKEQEKNNRTKGQGETGG